MRYRFTPYSWLILLAVALVSALIAFYGSWGLLTSESPFDLRDVIVKARNYDLIIYFLPIAWLGVWAARVHGSSSLIVGPAPGRSRSKIVAGQVVPLAVSTGIGWVVGWAPACVLALCQYWTPVDLVAMLTLTVGVSSLVTIGFLVAIPFGVRVGAFAVPVAMLAVMLLPGYTINELLNGQASSVALAYVWSMGAPGDGNKLLLTTELIRLVFYLLVAFTATMAACGLAEFRATNRRNVLAAAGWLVFPLVVAVVVALIRPILWIEDPNDQTLCQKDEGFTLCLYQIDEPQRAQIRGIITPMLTLMPTEMLSKAKITEDYEESNGTAMSAQSSSRKEWLGSQLSDLAWNLFMPYRYSCTFDGEAGLLQSDLQSNIVHQIALRAAAITTDPMLSDAYSNLITEMIYTSAESEEIGSRLSRLSDVEFRDWYASIIDHAKTCTLTESDLPS